MKYYLTALINRVTAFVFAPKHGLLASRAKARKALGETP